MQCFDQAFVKVALNGEGKEPNLELLGRARECLEQVCVHFDI